MKKFVVILLHILVVHPALLSFDAMSRELRISFASEEVSVDGVLDEEIWKAAPRSDDFRQYQPAFGEPVSLRTTLWAAYDDRMIYFAFECEDPETGRISATGERDGAIGLDDSIVILLDTFNDKSNAFLFAVNPRGTQFDCKICNNGKSWDIKWSREWQATCTIGENGWIAEIAIPFDEIAFDKNTSTMGFNAIRNIPRNEEEAFLILNEETRWDISKFGEIVGFDLTGVDSKHYDENRTDHFGTIEAIRSSILVSDNYVLKENLFYKEGSGLSDYEKERCLLDLYLPKDSEDFPVMVWFYGGSLEMGSKNDYLNRDMAKHFAHRGLAVAVVDYRLSPAATYPAYIEDAASSVAWVLDNIEEFGGDPNAVFIAGHSAGGYLTYMLGMDRKYLEAVGVGIDRIAGLIPLSGQTFTHYTVRRERGVQDPENTPVIDEAGPCYHAQKSGPPILVIWGDSDPEDRIEENRYFLALLKKVGYTNMEYLEAGGRTHWELVSKIPTLDDPVSEAVLEFVSRHSRPRD